MCVSDELDERQSETDGRRSRNRGRYLVMGRKRQDRLVISYVRSLDRQRSRQLSRALRAMRGQSTALCMRDGINAAFASASPPRRENRDRNAHRNRRGRKKKDGDGDKMAARSNNEMSKAGRRARKHRRRSSPETETETETET